MRRPFDAMLRWWQPSSSGNGHRNANGNGHAKANGNGNGHAVPVNGEAEALTKPRAEQPAPRATPEVGIDQPWIAQLDRERIPRTLRYPKTSLARILDQAADRYGDLPALVYNNKRWTYAELLARVNRMAGGLSRMGVRKGERVLLALPNCPEYVISFFAVQKLGAVIVNAGPLVGADDLTSIIGLTNPRVVIGLDLQAGKIVNAAKHSFVEHFVWVTLQSYQSLIKWLGYQIKLWQGREQSTASTAQHTTLAKLMENAPAKPPTIEPRAEDAAVLQPSSGTTGSVKLAQLSHRNLIANAMQVAVWMGARYGQERVLTVLPMFHVYGLTTGLINPVFCASTIILTTRFEAEATFGLLVREKPTVFPMVPLICDAISEQVERQDKDEVAQVRKDLRELRACISGAAPLPREAAERFEKLTGARVVEGYGLSESSPVTHANLITRPRYGSIGLPMPDTMVRISDLEDPSRDVPTGQPGEMLVAGPQIMAGYYGNPDETKRCLWTDAKGVVWLRTGDVVRMDEDGFFQVIDRKKDMIIRSGLKVYPAKVEKILLTNTRVKDAAVIGRADPVYTEEVVAFIVLSKDDVGSGDDEEATAARATLAQELRGECLKHLAPYEVPSKFEFTDNVPRSALGKVLKKELRKLPDHSTAEPKPAGEKLTDKQPSPKTEARTA